MSQPPPPAPPVQPETIMIEASARNAVRTTEQNDEWEVAVNPVQVYRGDEISVNMSFLDARGTGSEILEFSSGGTTQNNSQKLVFDTYLVDCGTNDMNKGKDLYNFYDNGTPTKRRTMENGKTYKPVRAVRWDRLLSRDDSRTEGRGFRQMINPNNNDFTTTGLAKLADPLLSAAYCINYRPDPFVDNLFNSTFAYGEATRSITQATSVEPEYTRVASKTNTITTREGNFNASSFFSKFCINLDALEYWEIRYNTFTQKVEIATLENVFSSIPIGTAIQLFGDWTRRQATSFDANNQDVSTQQVLPADKYYAETERSKRMNGIFGHFVVSDYRLPTTPLTLNTSIWNDGVGDDNLYSGQPAYVLCFDLSNSDGTFNYNTPLSFTNYVDRIANLYSINKLRFGGGAGASLGLFTAANGNLYTNAKKTTRHYRDLVPGSTGLEPISLTPMTINGLAGMPLDLYLTFSPFAVRSTENTPPAQFIPSRQYPRIRNAHADTYFNAYDTTLSQMSSIITNNPGGVTDQGRSMWGALYKQNSTIKQEGVAAWEQDIRANWTELTPYATYANSVFQLSGYDTYSNYIPIRTTITQIALIATTAEINIDPAPLYNANHNTELGLLVPEGTLIVLAAGTIYEEVCYVSAIDISSNTFPPTDQAAPNNTKLYIRARNLSGNPNIATNLLYNPANPGDIHTFPYDPVGWMDDAGTHIHPVGTTIDFWHPREGLNYKMTIEGQRLLNNYENGIPVTAFNTYRGDNTDPNFNYDKDTGNKASSINDLNFVSQDTKNLYSLGSTYCIYHRSDFSPGAYKALPPEGIVNNNDFTQSISNALGFGFLPLVQSKNQVQNTNLELVQISSTSPGFSSAGYSHQRPRTSINPHVSSGMLYYNDFEKIKQVGSLGGDANPNDPLIKLFNTTLFGWSPDSFEFYDTTQTTRTSTTTLKEFNSEGIDHICGYIPLMRQATFTTPKPYLTPTDLSNYFTEELHKTTNVKSLYDGTEIPNTQNRGLLQNDTLFPIYGSWGKGNYPNPATGDIERDYYTFSQCGGLAIGSVIGLDGNKMPSDWSEVMGNTTHNYTAPPSAVGELIPKINYSYLTIGSNPTDKSAVTFNEDTFPLFVRTQKNLIHLWNMKDDYEVPTWTATRNIVFDPASPTFTQTYVATYTWANYPIAPSAPPSNPNLSGNINGGTGQTSITTSAAPGNNLDTNLTGKNDPNYGAAASDVLVVLPNAADPPNETNANYSAREDNTYRETNTYPVVFMPGETHSRYLKVSQYIGTDNFVMTYNANVSAFEFQFLHQPFNSTFEVNNGVAVGGQNAVRIFDKVPGEVSNWERVSGINIINFTAPQQRPNIFTAYETQKIQPSYSLELFPNGINELTSMDGIGKAYMNKLGFSDTQIKPTTGTIVGYKNNEVGLGVDNTTGNANRYVYEPVGTTGSDTDIADAIIQTSFSAEDNPDKEAHFGQGSLMFYPAGVDTGNLTMKKAGVATNPANIVYDFAYGRYGQRGGLKSANHNKGMGIPNTAGTPQVRDDREVPRQLNPDGQQRSGYTIEIGSSPLRAADLPIKLTDGYYYILCPDIINDAQFYISTRNGIVIPAVSIVSKTYVSGDFYTTFQSPISWYAKKDYIISKLKLSIRNSNMDVPTNLGSNSSVIFSIRRFNPPVLTPPLTTEEQQNNAYEFIQQEEKQQSKGNRVSFAVQTQQDIINLANEVLAPAPQANAIQAFQNRLTQDQDIIRQNPREYFRQFPEVLAQLQRAQDMGRAQALVEAGLDPNVAGLPQAQGDFLQGLAVLPRDPGHDASLMADIIQEEGGGGAVEPPDPPLSPSPRRRNPFAGSAADRLAAAEAEAFVARGGRAGEVRMRPPPAEAADLRNVVLGQRGTGGAPSSSGYETGTARGRSQTPFSSRQSEMSGGAAAMDAGVLPPHHQRIQRPSQLEQPSQVPQRFEPAPATPAQRAEQEHYRRRGIERGGAAAEAEPRQGTPRQDPRPDQPPSGIPRPQ